MSLVWNKVTWYSRLLAVIFFLFGLPILTFYLGTVYETTKIALETYGVSSVAPQSSVSEVNTDITPVQPTLSGISGTIKNLQGTTTISVKSGSKAVTESIVSPNGKFVLFLDPGSYSIASPSGAFETATVTVKAGMMASLTLSN